jgi:hypothetical protein
VADDSDQHGMHIEHSDHQDQQHHHQQQRHRGKGRLKKQQRRSRELLTTYKPPIDDSLGDISHFAPVRRPWPVDQVRGRHLRSHIACVTCHPGVAVLWWSSQCSTIPDVKCLWKESLRPGTSSLAGLDMHCSLFNPCLLSCPAHTTISCRMPSTP